MNITKNSRPEEATEGLRENLKFYVKGFFGSFFGFIVASSIALILSDKGIVGLLGRIIGGSAILWALATIFFLLMFPLSFIWWAIEKKEIEK